MHYPFHICQFYYKIISHLISLYLDQPSLVCCLTVVNILLLKLKYIVVKCITFYIYFSGCKYCCVSNSCIRIIAQIIIVIVMTMKIIKVCLCTINHFYIDLFSLIDLHLCKNHFIHVNFYILKHMSIDLYHIGKKYPNSAKKSLINYDAVLMMEPLTMIGK